MVETKTQSLGILETSSSLEIANLLGRISINQPSDPMAVNLDVTNSASLKQKPAWVEITDLVDGMKFIYPVMVKIQIEGDYFIATCPTFDLFVTGDTYEGALQIIKEGLVDGYNVYVKQYPGVNKSAKKLLNLYLAFFGSSLLD